MTLLRGLVKETGDGSGAGKSLVASALAFIFGGCQYPATELQSWYDDEPPAAGVVLQTKEGDVCIRRGGGLSVTWPGQRPIKGKAAEAELDRIFGMDARTRAAVTYRGQDDTAGSFLSITDTEKKEFLAKPLGLDKFEVVAAAAAAEARACRDRAVAARARLEEAQKTVAAAEVAAATSEITIAPEDLEAEAALHDSAAEALRGQIATFQHHITMARADASVMLEERLAELDARLAALTVNEDPEELADARATLVKIEGRLERVRVYDAEKRAEHSKRREAVSIRLSEERAAQRELKRRAADLEALRAQEAALKAGECPTCHQAWFCQEAMELEVRIQRAVDQAAVDLIGAGTVEQTISRLEGELSDLGDYVPHPAGAELVAAAREASVIVLNLVSQARRARAGELEVIRVAKTAARQAAAEALQADIGPGLTTVAVMEDKVGSETARASELRRLAFKAEAMMVVALNRHADLAAAQSRVAAAADAVEELEKKAAVELDINALVGREGFLGLIFEDVLREIAAAANDILGRVANVRHVTFQFEMEKEAQNSNITRAITPVVYLRGRRISFKSPGLSGGMRASVRLAVDLGVGEVLAKRCGSYPGWLVLDETFNGLGAVSKEAVMETLAAYAGQRLVLVVDHDDRFQGLFDQRINIEQLDGRSKIV